MLLLGEVDFPVVVTSGNRGEEPIIDEQEAAEKLAGLASAFLVHDRRIEHRVDDWWWCDSLGGVVTIRLARGLGPFALPALEGWCVRQQCLPEATLAVGEQKGAIALWTGRQAILSPHLAIRN